MASRSAPLQKLRLPLISARQPIWVSAWTVCRTSRSSDTRPSLRALAFGARRTARATGPDRSRVTSSDKGLPPVGYGSEDRQRVDGRAGRSGECQRRDREEKLETVLQLTLPAQFFQVSVVE